MWAAMAIGQNAGTLMKDGAADFADGFSGMTAPYDLASGCRFFVVLSFVIRRHVWRAIIRSSSVGMTHAEALLPVVVSLGPPAVFAASSSDTPSHAASSQTRRLISGACSPIPAVKTTASNPPRAAASDPSSRLI